MSRSLLALVAVLAVVLVPSIGAAQTIPSPYRYMERGQEASLFAGQLAPDRGRFGFGPGDQWLIGGRYAVMVSNAFSLEGSAATTSGTRDVVNPARDEGDRVVGEADVQLLLLEARLAFSLTGRRTWRGLQPFAFVGGGATVDVAGTREADRLLEGRDRFDHGTRFTATFGGGFRYAMTQRWMLRVDGGVMMYKLGFPAGWRAADRDFAGVPESDWVSARTLTAGLAWRF